MLFSWTTFLETAVYRVIISGSCCTLAILGSLVVIFQNECECFTGVSKHEAFIVFECLENPVKHEARVFEMASQSAPNYKQRILFSLTFSFYFLLFN